MIDLCLNNQNKEIEIALDDDVSVELTNGASLLLKLININKAKNVEISAKIGENCSFNVIFADFSKGDINVKSDVKLVARKAICEWHLATLSSASSVKKFDINFYHEVGETKALMDNYGVAKDTSNIIFTGVNHIKEHAKKSETHQKAKIILFDKDASGTASPVLKIDENDVIASHGAIVGQLNSDHMFYLMSRGLSKADAKELITRGYLEPICKHFSDSNKELLLNAIKEAM